MAVAPSELIASSTRNGSSPACARIEAASACASDTAPVLVSECVQNTTRAFGVRRDEGTDLVGIGALAALGLVQVHGRAEALGHLRPAHAEATVQPRRRPRRPGRTRLATALSIAPDPDDAKRRDVVLGAEHALEAGEHLAERLLPLPRCGGA